MAPSGGKIDAATRVGRTGRAVERELIGGRQGLLLEAPDDRLELVEVGQVSVDGGELDRAHGVDPGEPALGEIAHVAGLHLAARADLAGHPVGDRLELLLADTGRPPAARASPRSSFWRSKRSRLPSRLTTVTRGSSARS